MSTNSLELTSRREIALLPTYSFSPSLVLLSDQDSGAAAALRVLRNHVLTHHVEEGRRALAVCAASAGVGCTFVAANLAVGMAQVGVKTLLIDANLRARGVDKLIQGAPSTEGLVQCLTSDGGGLNRFIMPDVLPNLSVLFSGGAAVDAQDFLATPRFDDLMQLALRDYDLTILDTSPANTCGAARLVASAVGYSLVVAREHLTYIEDLNTLAAQLRDDRVKVIGSVLNK